MSLHQTQCPNCHHDFTITDEQLSEKLGFVRCAHCKTVFSALEEQADAEDNTTTTLIADCPTNDAISNTKNKLTSSRKAGKNDFSIMDDFDSVTTTASTPVFSHHAASKEDPNEDTAWLEQLLQDADVSEQTDATTPTAAASKNPTSQNDFSNVLNQLEVEVDYEHQADQTVYRKKMAQRFDQQASSQHKGATHSVGMSLIWFFGSVLLLLTLGIQYAIFNINSLVSSPSTARQLNQLVQRLSLPYHLPMADPKLIDVQILKLAGSPKANQQSDLTFTLTNTTDNHLVYPSLKISLRSDHTVHAQTILTPNDYVETGNHYLMPHQIKPIKLRVDFPNSQSQQANIEPFY